jgi:hypothetical protein
MKIDINIKMLALGIGMLVGISANAQGSGKAKYEVMLIEIREIQAKAELSIIKPNAPTEIVEFKCTRYNECPELILNTFSKYYGDRWRLIAVKEMVPTTYALTRYFFEREKP